MTDPDPATSTRSGSPRARVPFGRERQVVEGGSRRASTRRQNSTPGNRRTGAPAVVAIGCSGWAVLQRGSCDPRRTSKRTSCVRPRRAEGRIQGRPVLLPAGSESAV